MVEFIKFMFRKKSEQKNQNGTEQKLLKVEDLFIFFLFIKLDKVILLDKVIFLPLEFHLFL